MKKNILAFFLAVGVSGVTLANTTNTSEGKTEVKKNEVTNKVSVSAVILYPIYVYTSCGIAVQTNQNWTPAQVEAYGNLVESIQCGN